jgi:hypothetical protein
MAMTWEVDREKIINVLELLNLVQETPGIASSEFLWFRGKDNKIRISIASYVSAEVELEGKGSWPLSKDFFIDRRILLPWIFAAREIRNKHRFQFIKSKHQLLVQHGTRKILLDSQTKVKGYGDIKQISSGKNSSIPLSDDLKEMLLCGKNCAVSDSVSPQLNCVYITKGQNGLGMKAYASSDRVYYLGVGKLEEGRISSSIPFPLKLIPMLVADGLKKVSWIGKYIVLSFRQGKIWQPVSAEALSGFPLKSIQRHADKSRKLPVTFTASSRRLSRLMVRLGYYLQSIQRKDWVVTIQGKKKHRILYIISKSIPGAGFTEKLHIATVLKKDISIDWPLDTLEPVFDFLSKKTKKQGVIVRSDVKHGVSYIQAGSFWLTITSRLE